MPTTEGGLDIKLDLTHVIDGFSGNEHSMPVTPLYNDVVQFWRKSGIFYTPTLIVAYGGPWAENYWYEKTEVHDDPKIRHFMPHNIVDDHTRRRRDLDARRRASLPPPRRARRQDHEGGRQSLHRQPRTVPGPRLSLGNVVAGRGRPGQHGSPEAPPPFTAPKPWASPRIWARSNPANSPTWSSSTRTRSTTSATRTPSVT